MVDYVGQYKPASLALDLGHNVGIQHLKNVPREIEADMVFVAERTLDLKDWSKLEKEFLGSFRLKGE